MNSKSIEQAEEQVAAYLLQERKFAYAIVNAELQVVRLQGDVTLFFSAADTKVGDSIYDIAPELVGAELDLQAVLRGELTEYRLPYVNRSTAEGELRYYNLVVLPFLNAQQQIIGLLHIVQDMTELGRLEQALVQQRNELSLLNDQVAARNLELAAANAELHQLDQVKSRFISVAAHELRNPLASILGYLEIMQEDEEMLTLDQQQCLNVIQRSSQRLLSITNNLLDLTTIESGRIELDLQRINVLTLVEHAATELQPRISAKKQTLILDSVADLPMALCDETRSLQILVNLLGNAVKYTKEHGTITVRLSLTEDEEFIQVAVQDTGIGIAEEDKDKIFRSFFRASNVHLSGESGTGLGLNVALSLAELQGGRLWFESKLQEGSTFYVTFPRDDSEGEHPRRKSLVKT